GRPAAARPADSAAVCKRRPRAASRGAAIPRPSPRSLWLPAPRVRRASRQNPPVASGETLTRYLLDKPSCALLLVVLIVRCSVSRFAERRRCPPRRRGEPARDCRRATGGRLVGRCARTP